MIESMDDIISLLVLTIIIALLIYAVYRVFLVHHLIKVDRTEADYYDEGDEDAYLTKSE